MEDFVELAAEAIDHVTEKHFDDGYDYVRGKFAKPISPSAAPAVAADPSRSNSQRDRDVQSYKNKNKSPSSADGFIRIDNVTARSPPATTAAAATTTAAPQKSHTLASSAASVAGPGPQRRYKNQLPSPERDRDFSATDPSSPKSRRDSRRPSSLERQSQTSEKVLRAYENETDDPSRRVESVLPDYKAPGRNRRRDMSHANGYGGDGYASSRPRSQQPPKSRYYDDDEGSDYDERTGRHYRSSSGRGYDDDRDYDREIIETERYRGPARPYDPRRLDSNDTGAYPSGTVAPYRRSQNDVTEVTRRSVSRGRRDKYDDRDRSSSRSRSRSRGGGIKGKVEELFDTSGQGIGVGIAGAVVGGLAGRQFGGKKNKNRDIIIGALVGGLGANAAENRYREWKEDRREREREERYEDERYEQRYDGRARSSIR